MTFRLFTDCWTLPIICTNAVVASVGGLTPLPRTFTVFHVTAPHFLWGALLPHSLPGNSVFPPSSSCSDRQGARGANPGLWGEPPLCGGRPGMRGVGWKGVRRRGQSCREASSRWTLNPEASSISDFSLARNNKYPFLCSLSLSWASSVISEKSSLLSFHCLLHILAVLISPYN